MENLFKLYRDSNQIDFKKIWKEGIFIFDSNVLLDLYRLPESAKQDLISVFKNKDFNNRIWIGFQVILEFLNNRLTIIGEQKSMFTKVNSITKDIEDKIVELNNNFILEIEKLNLAQRHSSINPDIFINSKSLRKTTKIFRKFTKHLKELESQHLDVNDVDNLKEEIINLFKGKIGEPFQKDELEIIYKDGEIRYNKKFPPGYMDEKKKESYFYEDKEFIRKFGDLILWKEIIKETKNKKFKYVVLVTGDVKEDWWEEKRGKKIGARKELLNEIYNECPDLDVFHLYNSSTFLRYAKKEIDNNIKDSSISEIENLMKYDLIFNNVENLGLKLRDNGLDYNFKDDFLNNLDVNEKKIIYNRFLKDYWSDKLNKSEVEKYILENDLSLNSKRLYENLYINLMNKKISESDWHKLVSDEKSVSDLKKINEIFNIKKKEDENDDN